MISCITLFGGLRLVAALPLAFLAALPLAAQADPPARAARLAYVSGAAGFAPAGSDEWIEARVNRPLWIGDRLWSADGRAELQIGGAALRLAPHTSLTVLNFDDRVAQFEVTQGSVVVHVRHIDDRAESIEIDTPTLAFVVHTEGDYRVDVDADRTAVGVRSGWAEVWGAGNAFRIDRRERFVFHDADLRNYEVRALAQGDAFDRWARERARREDQSASAQHVAPELVGYVDLDGYGEWRAVRDHGSVWYPRVEAGWAPYRNGHWTWIDPWGWTWVDDAPWGFAPFHYGRWTYVAGRWGWVPGPRNVRPVYAPALVAWAGGDSFSLTIASGARGIAWFPLAPGEIWRPAYDVSRDYFTRVNVSNTVVSQSAIGTVYDDVRVGAQVRLDYSYRMAPAAVTAVPIATFVESRPVQRHATPVSAQAIAQVPVASAPAVRPVMQSFVGAAQRAQARPSAESLNRPVVARAAPPPAVPTLQDKVSIVRERGRPIDREALEQVRPASVAPVAPPKGQLPAQVVPGGAVPPRQEQRAGPTDLRAGVRVLGERDAPPLPLQPPEKTPSGVAATPRGSTPAVPPTAGQGGASMPQGRAAGERRESQARPPSGREGPSARPGDDAPRSAEPRSQEQPTSAPTPTERRPEASPAAAQRPAPVNRQAPPTQRPDESRAEPPGRAGGSANDVRPRGAEAPSPRPNGSQPPAAQPSVRPPAGPEPVAAPESRPSDRRNAKSDAAPAKGKGKDTDDDEERRGKGARDKGGG